MMKAIKAIRMKDAKEDYAWALTLNDFERLEIAMKLVNDLWSDAHDGSPFPSMDRTIVSYMRPSYS